MKKLWFLAFLVCIQAHARVPFEERLYTGTATPFYGSAADSELQPVLDAVKRAQLAERMATMVNASLRLKTNLGVGFASCGRPNAFFDRSRRAVVICLEFIQMIGATAKNDTEFMMKLPREQFARGIDGLLLSAYFHELAHAVIYINQVPVTGREEDVADQFSVWFAMTFFDPKKTPVVTPAIWFWSRMAKERSIIALSEDDRRRFLADEHSLDDQRVYNMACLLHGMNPEVAAKSSLFVQLPEERASRCRGEYLQAEYSMQHSFKKFIKVKPLRGAW